MQHVLELLTDKLVVKALVVFLGALADLARQALAQRASTRTDPQLPTDHPKAVQRAVRPAAPVRHLARPGRRSRAGELRRVKDRHTLRAAQLPASVPTSALLTPRRRGGAGSRPRNRKP
ncbi:hypothetical protein ACFV4P_02580 [Kitasatospora sp. NPDC059795]|uniref:hypothetical protein n=1 Tax=Kitasatospora sp. NPDC059795 TaxID=3346949 RepID=UPI00366965E8